MRRGSVLVAGVVSLSACGVASGTSPNSGIAGRVLAGPTCPVETIPPQPQCAPRPLVVSVRIRRVGSTSPARTVRSGADGRFRVRLSPATYVVQALAKGSSPFPRPPADRRVRVDAGRFTSVTILYDTGIR